MSALAVIEFKPTPEDAEAAAAVIDPRRWGGRDKLRLVLAGALLGVFVFFLIALYDWRRWGLFIVTWEDVAAFAFAGVVSGWFFGKVKRARLPADSPLLMPRQVAIEADGLRITGQGFETFLTWRVIDDILTTNDVVLFRTQWSEVHAVPRRAFADTAAADAFERTVRDAWSAGRGGQQSPAGAS